MKKFRHSIIIKILLVIVPLLCIFLALFIGRYSVSVGEVLSAIFAPASVTSDIYTTVWYIRLPRAIAAAMCGASLAVSGAAYQGVFRNPLVSSGLLGVSNGAGFGACLGIIFLGGGASTYICAFVFALGAVALAYLTGKICRIQSNVTLILGGVIISGLFASLISIMKYIADPYSQLPSITFWFMGSFASVTYSQFAALIPMVAGIILIFVCRWKINVMSLGNTEAQALGLNVKLYKILIICGATLATAGAVCISGTIGWVGLIIPHLARMLVGNNNSRLIPCSISLGASFMVLMDILARNLTGAELPIGILCSLIGTPFFIYLLKKTRGGAWK